MVAFRGVLDDVTSTSQRLFTGTTEFIRRNPITATVVGLGSLGSLGGLAMVTRRRSKKKQTRKRVTRTRKRRRTPKRKARKRKTKRRVRRTPRTAGKGKDRSTRRIRHTKHGQPYVILRSGKARFIKRSSARRSRRLKGGRY